MSRKPSDTNIRSWSWSGGDERTLGKRAANKRGIMKSIIIGCILISSSLLMGRPAFAQIAIHKNYAKITVKGADVGNGMVTITASSDKTSIALNCNVYIPSCRALASGAYLMLRLPRKHGMYDCSVIDIYSESDVGAAGEILGEYCISEERLQR
jgi:hypothetical protein